MHVHREDTVLVLTGKDRGKKGRVIRLFPKTERVLVEKEASVHLSNLQVVCSKCGKATRVAYKVLAGGQKARTCKKCGEILDKEK